MRHLSDYATIFLAAGVLFGFWVVMQSWLDKSDD